MASVYYLIDDAIYVQEDISFVHCKHSESEKEKYNAALKIQKMWRGYAVRKKLKIMIKAAVVLQKYIRGFLTRYYLPDVLHRKYDEKCLELYNKMAIRIQSAFKGYKTRQVVSIKRNVMARKLLHEANKEMSELFKEQIQIIKRKTQEAEHTKSINFVVDYIMNRHHLLRTQCIEGVLSIHGKNELSELEKILASTSWTKYMIKLRKIYKDNSSVKYITPYKFDSIQLRNDEEAFRHRRSDNHFCKQPLKGNGDDDYYNKRPFLLCSNIKRKPYERMLFSGDEYVPNTNLLTRSSDSYLNITDTNFDLFTLKNIAKESKVPPYYIDFWIEKCTVHTLPENRSDV